MPTMTPVVSPRVVSCLALSVCSQTRPVPACPAASLPSQVRPGHQPASQQGTREEIKMVFF